MTWITPLAASMSLVTTVAPLIDTTINCDRDLGTVYRGNGLAIETDHISG